MRMAKDKEGEAQISADEAALSEAQNQLDVAFAEQKQLSAMSDYARIVAPFQWGHHQTQCGYRRAGSGRHQLEYPGLCPWSAWRKPTCSG